MKTFILAFMVVRGVSSVFAEESSTPKPYFITRALRIAPTVQTLLDPNAFPRASQTGTGLSLSYELVTSPSFALGIYMAGRIHPGEEAMAQLGYGLLFKHYIYNTRDEEAFWRPYAEYGLLLHLTWAHDHWGSATAHDTRLGLGMDFKAFGLLWFVAEHLHFSTAKLFDSQSFNLNRMETELGLRLRW